MVFQECSQSKGFLGTYFPCSTLKCVNWTTWRGALEWQKEKKIDERYALTIQEEKQPPLGHCNSEKKCKLHKSQLQFTYLLEEEEIIKIVLILFFFLDQKG